MIQGAKHKISAYSCEVICFCILVICLKVIYFAERKCLKTKRFGVEVKKLIW